MSGSKQTKNKTMPTRSKRTPVMRAAVTDISVSLGSAKKKKSEKAATAR